jgi:hypothetical protein
MVTYHNPDDLKEDSIVFDIISIWFNSNLLSLDFDKTKHISEQKTALQLI